MTLSSRQGPSQADKGPPAPAQGPLRLTEGLFKSKDIPRKLIADLVQHMALSQVGVALACIGVALFQVGVARATPKVYKSPPLV